MNNRIKELAEHAGIDTAQLQMYSGGFPREDLLILEDFAQLLIEEVCFDMINLHMDVKKINIIAKSWGLEPFTVSNDEQTN